MNLLVEEAGIPLDLWNAIPIGDREAILAAWPDLNEAGRIGIRGIYMNPYSGFGNGMVSSPAPAEQIPNWIYNGLPAAERNTYRDAWPTLDAASRQFLSDRVTSGIMSGEIPGDLSRPYTPFPGAYMAPVPPSPPIAATSIAAVPAEQIPNWIYNGLPAAERNTYRDAWPTLDAASRQFLSDRVTTGIMAGDIPGDLSRPIEQTMAMYGRAAAPAAAGGSSPGEAAAPAPTQAGLGGGAVLLLAGLAAFMILRK